MLNLKYSNILQRNDDFVLKLEKTKSGKEQYKALHLKAYKKIMSYREFIKNMIAILAESKLTKIGGARFERVQK